MANGQLFAIEIEYFRQTCKETLYLFTIKLHVVNFMNDFNKMYVNLLSHVISRFMNN